MVWWGACGEHVVVCGGAWWCVVVLCIVGVGVGAVGSMHESNGAATAHSSEEEEGRIDGVDTIHESIGAGSAHSSECWLCR